ncbi:YheC/YheD family protein [Paenibacillus antarcticus]|uniref:Endospore coat-associated protein n=1 Tax=Paenibacillus antarcticus TaxID=253703 RepID=A0A168QAW8_9BACL|nr:YheC/YheD family protein [Paenibacillus antarcticus]OAB47578.1 endospore coat-associated protein [Paenibacillus antarcticus]
MKGKRKGTITSKWLKTNALLSHSEIRQYIPMTQRLTSYNLSSMLAKYEMVYIKPERGTYGNGVIRAEVLKQGVNKYQYQIEMKKRTFKDYNSFFQSLKKVTKKRSYLVQMGIHLLKYQKRRFDVRVMVQLNPKVVWETTGIIGRVAHPGKIVTNYHSGGQLVNIEKLLSSHLSLNEQKSVIGKMSRLGVTIAKQLRQKYPDYRQVGVDVGLDVTMKPWIIEVNTNPDPYIFKKLADKSVFRKVMRYRRLKGPIRILKKKK